ncbi:hypothetical protein C3492_20080 [Streptomyces sp. Ru62]|uniref:hypothetical protein n=1 Tax=Streptomyces sp. Ru62 TaxID=2080745 RepID=UPI000CDDB16B|nr:hypothetical protein [Streptomyces sp. Ru62]POX61618.1 hypothetical protein C3492_20080 [Streptomyces sp. Ru62]
MPPPAGAVAARSRSILVLAEGVLVAGSEDALGHGDVRMAGGTLRVAGRLRVRGAWAQDAGTPEVTVRAGGKAPLTVGHRAVLGGPVVPAPRVDAELPPAAGSTLPVLAAPRFAGRFEWIEVNSDQLRAVPVYTAEGLSVRLVRR